MLAGFAWLFSWLLLEFNIRNSEEFFLDVALRKCFYVSTSSAPTVHLYLLMHAVKQKTEIKDLYLLSLTLQNTGDMPIKRKEFSGISFCSMFGWPCCFGTVLRQHTTVESRARVLRSGSA